MRDLTVAVPRAPNVIKSAFFTFVFLSCSITRTSGNNGLTDEEYAVINAFFATFANSSTVYYKTWGDSDWGSELDIDLMVSEGFGSRFIASRLELEQLFPQELLDEFKIEIRKLTSLKLNDQKLIKLVTVKSLRKSNFHKICKPIVIGDVAILRSAMGHQKQEISILILEKKDNIWIPRHSYWERLVIDD